MSSLEERIRRIEDHEALQALFHGYLFAVDSLSDLDGMLALFTEDVVFDLSPINLPCLHGHAGMREFFGEVFGYMSHHAHFGCNFSVRRLEGDSASAWAYVIGMGVRDGVKVELQVKYFLDYVRTPAGWKINRFTETTMLPMPESLEQVHRERSA